MSLKLLMLKEIGVMAGCVLMIFSVIVINIILWKGYLVGRKIKDKTYDLGKDLTNEKVEDYIKFIDRIEIPPRKYYWNMIKAGYEIVKISETIDEKLVEQLKITILSKGILVN